MSAREASPPELVELARANDIGLVSVPIIAPEGGPEWGLATDAALRREVMRRCRDCDVKVDLIESVRLPPDSCPGVFEAAVAAGAELGARRVIVMSQDPDASRRRDNVGQVARLAATHGLDILIEYTPRMDCKTLDQARTLLEQIGSPNVGVAADSLHTFRGGVDLAQLAAAGPRMIARAQLCDGPAHMPMELGRHEAMNERQIPGEGQLPLIQFLRALPEDIVVGMEVPMASLAQSGVRAAERVARIVKACRAMLRQAAAVA